MEVLGHGEGLDELLRLVRRQGSPAEVLELLGRRTGANVAWIGRGGAIETATAGFPRRLASALTPQVERLAGGRLAAATTRVGELEVRLEAFGAREPRPVLVTVSASALSREAAALASQAGGIVDLLSQASEADDGTRGYEAKAAQLRFAVLTALLAGDVTMARRMTTGDVPPILNAERVRVHLLHCTPADRDRLTRTYLDPSGYHGPGLMVNCPVFREQLICPVADDPELGGRFRQGEVLRRLVRENPGYALGVSRPHPLAATAEAYGEAVHALAVARNSPGRLAAYRGRPSLVHVLPRRAALAWARGYLEPLQAVPKPTVDVVRLAVTFSRSGVARLLHLSRTTVTAHCRRAEEALGIDLGEVRTRATLDLALSLTATLQADPSDTVQPVAPPLGELLAAYSATAWAEPFLRPLRDTQHRDLHLTVAAWIDANTDAQRTAAQVGLSRNTVRAHLRAAERLLNRDLLTTGSGIHDVVHALRVTAAQRAHPPTESGQRAQWSSTDVAS
ncbi:DNA-binding CsgD family transcriptional regulator [Streptomyces aurantiacus]|uniref:helix-turn-helix domain-containing protein n=1 Tax=Streptomyces aurantiacus TaxID=47760 RepID=UPI00278F1BD0|nr:helix-turn-helix domain-containing protein [Streptomyces aurantiacus]MDQ0777467.1 DNA-binding CsgD family transcriptional regulator [Streptomyces aurantiacus]